MLRVWVCPMRMSALEEMMDRQKLMRMTERSERMYLWARAGGVLHAQQGLSSSGARRRGHEAGPLPPCRALASIAPALLLTSQTRQGPGGPDHPTHGKRCFANHSGRGGGSGPGGQAGPQGVRADIRGGAAGRGAGYFRVTGVSALGQDGVGAGQEGTPLPLHPVTASTPHCGPPPRSCCPWSRHTGDRAGPSGWGNLGLTLSDPQSQPLALGAHWEGSLCTHAPIPGLLMAGRGRPHTVPPPGDQGTNTSQAAPEHGGPWWRGLEAWGRRPAEAPTGHVNPGSGSGLAHPGDDNHIHRSRGLGAQQSQDRVLSWVGPTQRISREPSVRGLWARGWAGAGRPGPVGCPYTPLLPTSIQGTAVGMAGGDERGDGWSQLGR